MPNLKIWLIQVGEPLPGDAHGGRLMRTGLFAAELSRRGHDVTWWCSTFDHTHKVLRANWDCDKTVSDRYRIRLIACPPYYSNVGLRRIVNHRYLASRFASLAREASRPDVVVCSYPTIELSLEAVLYGSEKELPVILDVRDLWPDIFLDLVPRFLRPAGRLVLWSLFEQGRRVMRNATTIMAITEGYLDWALAVAGRSRREDRVFPMGYPSWLTSSSGTDNASSLVLSKINTASQLIVCFFGTVGRQFDLDTVIRAAALLKGAAVTFILCGTGERLDCLRRAAKDLQNVVMPGHVNHSEIMAIMRKSAIGLAPYRLCDNFNLNVPNKIYEYLSGGLVILSPLRGEVARLIEREDVGLHYPEGDATALARCIRALGENRQELERMRGAARRLFDQRYRAESINEQMAVYVEQVVADFRSRQERELV